MKGDPFISLVGDSCCEGLWTVMSFDHQERDRLCEVREVGEDPGWLQVLHGKKVLDRLQGIPCPRRVLGQLFSHIPAPPRWTLRRYLADAQPSIPLKTKLSLLCF